MAFRQRIDFQRPSGGVCLAYRNGYCDKGTACNFIHQEDDGRQKQIFVGNLHNEVGEDDLYVIKKLREVDWVQRVNIKSS